MEIVFGNTEIGNLSVEYPGECCVALKDLSFIVDGCDDVIHGWAVELVGLIFCVFQCERSLLSIRLLRCGCHFLVLPHHRNHLSPHKVGTWIQGGSCHHVKHTGVGALRDLGLVWRFLHYASVGLVWALSFFRRAAQTVCWRISSCLDLCSYFLRRNGDNWVTSSVTAIL